MPAVSAQCVIIKGRSQLGVSKAIVKTTVDGVSEFFWGELAAGCQIVLGKSNIGAVILCLSDEGVAC